MSGRACPFCPGRSDVDLFGYGQRIVDLDTEISDGAFDLGVSEQNLHRSQIACASIDQRGLGSSKRMGTKAIWVEPDAGDPTGDEARVLPGRHTPCHAPLAFKQKFARFLAGDP
jgi:hypothetical protein